MAKKIDKNWNHTENEEKIYQNWENSGFFKPEYRSNEVRTKSGDSSRPQTASNNNPFVIMMPPPNVTGKLHIGHALFVTLEDIMTRYHRLIGDETLWLPGTDHAGIATQTVVDKALKKEGINRRDLGREKFVEKVWEWKKEYGGIITQQIRRLGASCDWSRERFTLDEGLSAAVNEAFVKLYEKGLIYRGEYIVNWCPKCGTAIADDEVEHETQQAKLYFFKYDKNFPVTIATTRPETKLGDTAIAVNPSDERYKKYIGQEFEIDLDGVKRKIKIIADRSIDSKFGTGAVGLTPAHSAVDWKIAEVNNLPKIKVINEIGKIVNTNEKYDGLKVLEAREKIIEYLKSNSLLDKEQEIENNLSICYRCGGAIEPLPSLQWFVKMDEMAKRAKKAVEDGEIEIIPKRFEKVYFNWMDNIRDWCISRQLWWGHRIPVWYNQTEISNSKFLISNEMSNEVPMQESGSRSEGIGTNQANSASKTIYIGLTPPTDEEGWVQDEDVLDTWFSSALWPFSTLNWPDIKSPDYQKYYPTTVLETGYDILFFWVAKMIIMGQELTGKVPFKTVYLHGMVRDEHNRKMSKSLGNSLDPLDEIDKYGTDALRMSLIVGATPGNDIAVGDAKIRGMRNFSNKIWNASRFVALQVSGGDLQSGVIGDKKIENLNIDSKTLTEADKSILEKHQSTIQQVTSQLKKYQFSMAGEELYNYFWHEFCDSYIETAKGQIGTQRPQNYSTESTQKNNNITMKQYNNETTVISDNTKKVLTKVLSESLIMLHPFVPFVTEAVWQDLREIYPALAESIMVAKWPE